MRCCIRRGRIGADRIGQGEIGSSETASGAKVEIQRCMIIGAEIGRFLHVYADKELVQVGASAMPCNEKVDGLSIRRADHGNGVSNHSGPCRVWSAGASSSRSSAWSDSSPGKNSVDNDR